MKVFLKSWDNYDFSMEINGQYEIHIDDNMDGKHIYEILPDMEDSLRAEFEDILNSGVKISDIIEMLEKLRPMEDFIQFLKKQDEYLYFKITYP